jgi:hypothetical protein
MEHGNQLHSMTRAGSDQRDKKRRMAETGFLHLLDESAGERATVVVLSFEVLAR